MDRQTDLNIPATEVYSPIARFFHWLIFVIVATMLPLGFYMVWRGNATNFDDLTNTLYSTHKTLGFTLLCLVVLRLLYRLVKGAPRDEPTLRWFHKAGAHSSHWGLYLLLLVTPMLGWVGVSYYGARDILGGFKLPALTAENQDMANIVLTYHGWAAIALMCLAGLHILAAIYHYAIRRDNVLSRMLPSLRRS